MAGSVAGERREHGRHQAAAAAAAAAAGTASPSSTGVWGEGRGMWSVRGVAVRDEER